MEILTHNSKLLLVDFVLVVLYFCVLDGNREQWTVNLRRSAEYPEDSVRRPRCARYWHGYFRRGSRTVRLL